MRIRLAPSLLSADFGRLAEAAKACETGGADQIHFDVMDGHFVPNLTVGPIVLKAIRKETRLPLDVHLMIERADLSVVQYLDAGASSVAVHVEAAPHLHRLLTHIKGRGARAGVAINPGTSLQALDEALRHADYVLVMTVNPGWGGQEFITGSLDRIRRLADRISALGCPIDIAVDGGVNVHTIAPLYRAGARTFVAGSAVFGTGDVPTCLGQLRRAASISEVTA